MSIGSPARRWTNGPTGSTLVFYIFSAHRNHGLLPAAFSQAADETTFLVWPALSSCWIIFNGFLADQRVCQIGSLGTRVPEVFVHNFGLTPSPRIPVRSASEKPSSPGGGAGCQITTAARTSAGAAEKDADHGIEARHPPLEGQLRAGNKSVIFPRLVFLGYLHFGWVA